MGSPRAMMSIPSSIQPIKAISSFMHSATCVPHMFISDHNQGMFLYKHSPSTNVPYHLSITTPHTFNGAPELYTGSIHQNTTYFKTLFKEHFLKNISITYMLLDSSSKHYLTHKLLHIAPRLFFSDTNKLTYSVN